MEKLIIFLQQKITETEEAHDQFVMDMRLRQGVYQGQILAYQEITRWLLSQAQPTDALASIPAADEAAQ